MQKILVLSLMTAIGLTAARAIEPTIPDGQVVLFEDGFGGLRTGNLGSVIGAHTEYHYLPEAGPKGNWYIAAFVSPSPSQLAWKVERHEGQPVLVQTYQNMKGFEEATYSRPFVVGGDDLWTDYTFTSQFTPAAGRGKSGVAFRISNCRCYYFFGVEGTKVVLKMIQHESDFHVPFEKVLASQDLAWKPGQDMSVEITVAGSHIVARLNDVTLTADDSTYPTGKIGLTSDMPTRFDLARVTALPAERDRLAAEHAKLEAEFAAREAANPKMVLWKKFKIDGFGVGRNIRFGDLTGEGKLDVLIGQVEHHGPKDCNSELSCLTALTLDGKVLWQIGTPDDWKDNLTDDVAFQIHDIDGDGHNEVIYCMNMELIVADGKTGKTKYKVPTPLMPTNEPAPYNRFPRILGDAICFADFRGMGRAADLIIKDRYHNFWVYNDKLEFEWSGQCNTGHYPFPYDVDGTGKQDLAIGYNLYGPTGKHLWSHDPELQQHADGVAIVKFHPGTDIPPRMFYAASDEGMLSLDLQGNILRHDRLGHVQNPVVGDFRPDMPGLETIAIDFWGNQGIVHFFDADGKMYKEFQPAYNGSMCSPLNWTGQPGEYWILSPNVEDGGVFDGWGRRVMRFPADGHPDMCCAVLDITGDCRDEIVVWDPHEMWIYTQSDNPKSGRLYKPKRNPLYNFSNYQATVSLPGWSDDKP